MVLVILDAARYSRRREDLEADLKPLAKLVGHGSAPVVVAVNKVDAVKDKPRLLPVLAAISEALPGAELFPISAANGLGVDELLRAVLSRLPEGEAQYDAEDVSTAPVRFMNIPAYIR